MIMNIIIKCIFLLWFGFYFIYEFMATTDFIFGYIFLILGIFDFCLLINIIGIYNYSRGLYEWADD